MLEDFFENYFKIEKAYRKYFQDEMEKYHLTPNELLVLLFLARDNGGCNTARDIAQYEGVSKGLVARSVESLVEKQFLVVERDAADKRICHLYVIQLLDTKLTTISIYGQLFAANNRGRLDLFIKKINRKQLLYIFFFIHSIFAFHISIFQRTGY